MSLQCSVSQRCLKAGAMCSELLQRQRNGMCYVQQIACSGAHIEKVVSLHMLILFVSVISVIKLVSVISILFFFFVRPSTSATWVAMT